MAFEVKTGIPRPGPKGRASNGQQKYPLGQMAVGSFFVVPQSQKEEGDTPQKFRNRINQSVRTYKQKRNNEAHLQPGHDPATYQQLDFTVILLGDAPANAPDEWEPGDVGVWRDS